MTESTLPDAAPEEEPADGEALPPALAAMFENTDSVAVVPEGDGADFDSVVRTGPITGPGDVAVAETVPDTVVQADVRWAEDPEILPRSAGWALTFAVLGLVMSFIVGWGFPIGIVGMILAILALRRPWERREVAVWALVLSLLSLVYSAGWLGWAFSQGAFEFLTPST